MDQNNKKPSNPQAFPSKDLHPVNERLIGQHHGMTLRDYFAAKAMQAMESRDSMEAPVESVAKLAYELADAMLVERTKN